MYTLIKTASLTLAEFSQAEGDFSVTHRSQVQSLCSFGMSPQRLKDALVDGEYVLLTSLPNLPLIEKQDNWVISYLCQAELSHTGRSRIQQQLDSQQRTTSGKGAAGRVVQAGYAPVVDIEQTYQPEPVRTDEPDPKFWNYCFEILGSEASFKHYFKNCSFRLMKTRNEDSCSSWQKTPTEYGVRYTTKARVNESKQLRFTCTDLPVSPRLPHHVQLSEQGEEEVKDAFIPVVPAVQLEQRLGFPVKGYFYHFHNKELVQEYKVVDDGMHFFYVTLSDDTTLNDDRAFSVNQSAIMVFWKINGQTAENQHLVYLDRQITRNELDNLSDEWLSEHGVLLDLDALLQAVSQTPAERPESPEGNNDTLPAQTPQTYHQALDTYYSYPKDTLDFAPLRAITKAFVKQDVPVVRIACLPPPKVLRIGVFFDGTGQNNDNDRYKESRGDKSRTNIARLYEAYPQREGESYAIYVSGVGTVDDAYKTPAIIDNGEDETSLAQALGIEIRDALKGSLNAIALYQPVIAAGLNVTAQEMLEKTSALYKWQSYIKQFSDLVDLLTNNKIYQDITHIEFDVFGFSRGAALARHFVNAALAGLPDFRQPREGEDNLSIWPNLLGTEQGESFNRLMGYKLDSSRQVSIRFVGLFDTVGSFYLPGNSDDGNFELTLPKGCANKVVQLCAHHEYRYNFPLTSLKSGGHLPYGFYEEVFPGAHSDVGGGYPASEQYYRKDLPQRYGIPTQSSYNRELVHKEYHQDIYQKTISYSALSGGYGSMQAAQNLLQAMANKEKDDWTKQTLTDYNQYGLVTVSYYTLCYYRLQPVNNALAGLTQERMKQQAAIAGIEWDERYYELPKDFQDNPELEKLCQELLSQPLGSIGPKQWQRAIQPYMATCIHRPHDELINPGCENAMAWLINRPNKRGDKELYRKVYEN